MLSLSLSLLLLFHLSNLLETYPRREDKSTKTIVKKIVSFFFVFCYYVHVHWYYIHPPRKVFRHLMLEVFIFSSFLRVVSSLTTTITTFIVFVLASSSLPLLLRQISLTIIIIIMISSSSILSSSTTNSFTFTTFSSTS